MLEGEIYQAFCTLPPGREDLWRYAAACTREITRYSPMILEEMEGLAEGSGLALEEVVLLSLHEELYHWVGNYGTDHRKRLLQHQYEHCTALAVGPPNTRDGRTYVGQSWDWMDRLRGQSRMILWKRSEGPSVLAYAYPGLIMGAGTNSAGIALGWTGCLDMGVAGPCVGVPSYVILAQLLAQETLEDAIEEAQRAKQAGWFTFLLADAEGELVNVEASPERMVVKRGRGHFARVYFGTPEMNGVPEDGKVKLHPQCRRMKSLLEDAEGRIDRALLQGFFGDHRSTICKHPGRRYHGVPVSTLDAMLFDTTAREAYVTRGPSCSGRWKRFSFEAS
jgi:isopenicillin-N N-acyltransferase-like protein